MHRPGAKVPFDGMGFPLILADSLRARFRRLWFDPAAGRSSGAHAPIE